MLLPIQQHITKYNYITPVSFRNKVMPSFKGAINLQNLEKQLSTEVKKLESKHGQPIIFTLAMAGLASLIGVYNKFANSSDCIQMLLKVIQNPDINITSEETLLPEEVHASNESTVPEIPDPNETITPENTSDNNVSKSEPASNRKEVRTFTPQEIDILFKNQLNEKPERKGYFVYLEDYPELRKKYKNLIIKKAIDESDKTNNSNLDGFEHILRRLPRLEEGYINADDDIRDKRLDPATFLENFNTVYIENFGDICATFHKEKELAKQNRSGNVLHFLHLIAKKQLNPEDLKEYLKYPSISFYEYGYTKQNHLTHLLEKFNDIKEKYNLEQYRLRAVPNEKFPDFALQFNTWLSTREFLKANAEFFVAMYGDATLRSDKLYEQKSYTKSNLRKELTARLEKDPTPTDMFNFVKYINPEAIEKYNYTNEELNNIKRPSADTLKRIKNGNASKEEIENYGKFKELMQQFGLAFGYLDDNDKFKEILDTINDKDIFKYDYMRNLHSKLRFICRFVINKELEPGVDFKEKCKSKVEDLEAALKEAMKKSVLVNRYREQASKGMAPHFCLCKNNNLGQIVRIAINGDGDIRTIYEKKESANKNNNDYE